MDNILKRIMLAGIGSVAYTYEKGAELVEEMVKKGSLTVNQGKELTDDLKAKLKKDDGTQEKTDYDLDKLKSLLSQLNLATKADIVEINKRLDNLENK